MSLLFEQSASAQLEEARLAVLERFQGCEQCIRNVESKFVIMHECRCSEVVIENGKARKVRSEDEAVTAIDRLPESAVLEDTTPINSSGGQSLQTQNHTPPPDYGETPNRKDEENAGPTGEPEHEEEAQSIALPQSSPVAIGPYPQGNGVRVSGSRLQQALTPEIKERAVLLAREKALTLEAEVRDEKEARRKKQASRDAEQAHYMERVQSRGIAAVLEAAEARVSQESSGEEKWTKRVQSNPSETPYDGLRHPGGRAHRSVYQRDPE